MNRHNIFVTIFLVATLGLVASVSLERAKRTLPPSWTSVEGVNSCFGSFQSPQSSALKCIPLNRPERCQSGTWFELAAALGAIRKRFVAPPAYLSIKNHRSCLDERQVEDHMELCLPNNKPDTCPQESWEKMQEDFDGIGCGPESPDWRIGKFGYVEIGGWQLCLLTYKSGSHSERCMPSYQPDLCSNDAWERLQEVFYGPRCPKRSKLISRVGPPPYLSVQGHKKCLKTANVGSHSVKCLPRSKPDNCNSGTWFTLQSVFDGITCPSENTKRLRLGPPAYLGVEGFEDCLGSHHGSETHEELCFPDTKPDLCLQDSWEQLQYKFEGIGCRKDGFFVGGPSSLPPRYLDVENFEKCLDFYKPSPSHEERCLPNIKPRECALASWLQILNVFVGVECPGFSEPPAYLSVDGHKDCLSHEQHSSGTFTRLCLPLEKKQGCQQRSFDMLKEVFDGPVCKEHGEIPVIGGALRPPHLFVPNHKECLGTMEHPSGGFNVTCVFYEKPESCPQESFDELKILFDDNVCPSATFIHFEILGPVLPPKYLVDGHDKCLGEQVVITGSSSELCKLYHQPDGCDDDVWMTVNQHFDGFPCRDQSSRPAIANPMFSASKPLFLVSGHKKCLGEQLSVSGFSNELCKYFKQPSDCDDGVWATVSKHFNGNYCEVQKRSVQRLEPLLTGRPPAYLSVPSFQNCLGSKKDGTQSSLCIPSTIKAGCPESSWKKLKEVFKGDTCTDILSSLPPLHLSIPNHQDCLGTQQSSSGTHYESCLPHRQPERCLTSTWNAVIEVFKGDVCQENLIGIPEQFNDIDGALDCFADTIETEADAKCLPLHAISGCNQETYDKLLVVLFDSSANVKNTPLVADITIDINKESDDAAPQPIGGLIGLAPPSYLRVPGHQDCLGTRRSGTQLGLCMPNEKPSECDTLSWDQLSVVFDGDACDDHDIENTRPGIEEWYQKPFWNPSSESSQNLPKRSCQVKSNCFTGETCHRLDYGGSYCVPDHKSCLSNDDCPSVGRIIDGAIEAGCSDSGFCQYATAMLIA